MEMALLCLVFVVAVFWLIHIAHLPIFFRVTSLHDAFDIILKDMGKSVGA